MALIGVSFTASSSSPSLPEVAQTTKNLTPPRLLNAAELGWVERNLFLPDRQIIIDQSFWLGLREVGEVAFVATEFQNSLEFHVMQTNGEVMHTLPPNSHTESWIFSDLKAVSFQEIDFDGSEPDVIVIAEYISGNRTFPVTTVYFNQGSRFTTDPELNQLLTDRGVSTIAEAEDILRGELLFLP
ncbi:hypothetical protein PMG71_04695 [Roseofilum sp. BLCC_M154]|uniref:Uncharacterized protein n=1 Tax=Roseofilum acuticapitatum BLCC-M154 TaxID=3022444 RepID=A0ABT7AP92_9CYAN|nr:hypothetical protein [Roseofilum acuticapitatum]MDJ1168718.1 hypothetical protein [Roseofilum acuticapitatum BLCC-M154]